MQLDAHSHDSQAAPRQLSRAARGFALWGGALAWLAHLLLAWVIAEFGCLSDLRYSTLLGITVVAWMAIAASLAMLALSVAATVVGWIGYRRMGRAARAGVERGTDDFLARTAYGTSGLFTFIIAVQSIPIAYYLQHC